MAKETARKVEDIAEAVQGSSAISVISRSKATVLKLEAKALRAAMEKKGRESAEDLHRAQKLLRDVIILQDAARTKKAVKLQATNAPNVTAKKTVRLVESPKPEKQLPRGPDKGTEDDIIVDEFLKDEESRALLRRASTFQPITAPAVCNPDDDIVAMVAKMVEDKTGSATASVTPVLDTSFGKSSPQIGISVASAKPAVAKKPRARTAKMPTGTPLRSPAVKSPAANSPVPKSPAPEKQAFGTPTSKSSSHKGPTTKNTTNKSPTVESRAANSPAAKILALNSAAPSSRSPPNKDIPASPRNTDRAAKQKIVRPASTKRSSPVAPDGKTRKGIAEKQVRGVPPSPLPGAGHPTLTEDSKTHQAVELDNVIKDLLKSADQEMQKIQIASQGTPCDVAVATLVPSGSRSVESESVYAFLLRQRKTTREQWRKFCTKVCCTLVLLAIAVAVVGVALALGSRAVAMSSATKDTKVREREMNYSDSLHVPRGSGQSHK